MSDIDPVVTLQDQAHDPTFAAARPDCDHHWISTIHDGQCLRTCSLCKDPNWEDVRPADPWFHVRRKPWGPVVLTTRAPNRREARQRFRNWLAAQRLDAPRLIFTKRWL